MIMWIHNFPKGISSKVNIIVQLEWYRWYKQTKLVMSHKQTLPHKQILRSYNTLIHVFLSIEEVIISLKWFNG